MIEVGKKNRLDVVKIADFGVFLDAGEFGTTLLSNRHLPEEGLELGDSVEVFLYFDSDSQVVATTEEPIAQVGEWGLMSIAGVNSTGAFASWGIKEKESVNSF